MQLLRFIPGLAVLGLLFTAAAAPDPLETGFLTPPDSAKPQTWWHWMNGNITREGITADLEAMKDIGLGGATIVNVDCGIPEGKVPFMSPEWQEMFKFSVQEANRLGLELCIENCAGWSSSGGPWNTPEHAMQKVVTSELHVNGPTHFTDALPQPPVTLGYYRDIAVLAFPESADENVRMSDFAPLASASGGVQTGSSLTDGNPDTFIDLPAPKRGKPQFAQLEFQKPFPARTVKITGARGMPVCSGEIQVSDDGQSFRTVRPFAFASKKTSVCLVSLGAQPVTARFWRVLFKALGPKVKAEVKTIPLADIELAPRLTVDEVDAKDGLNGGFVLSSAVPDQAVDGVVASAKIINLTDKLTADGHLDWQAPAGQWVILRLGYTPTGVNNHPAPATGLGLECDKFSKAALDAHWAGFMQKILDDIGPLAGTRAFDSSLIDSYEVGGQNWSGNFREEFRKRRGYDLLKFMPAFTGRVVDNPAVSERFLWDIRRTIADLFAENYYAHFNELCQAHGLKSVVEPYTGPFESLQVGASAGIVMGEFWSGSQGHPSIKLAASVAHIYGKPIVGAESFTAAPEAGRWQNDPYSLKTLGDLMYCQGLNRYTFHRYAMQPWTNRWPGMTMGQWGFHFERTVTWWQQGKAWINYIQHCQFLLQQGHPLADAAYFTGQSTPVEMRVGDPALPYGYDYDAINADVLLHGAMVKNGRITLPSGMSYAVLILPPSDADMTPELLKRISKLVRDGATVVGQRPQHSPSLEDYPRCDAEVQKLAARLWGRCDGVSVHENAAGQGHVYWGEPLADIFSAQHLEPDFAVAHGSEHTKLAYVHRDAGAADIYFVSNQRRQFDSAEVSFRLSGKLPELWHPDTGMIEPAPVWSTQNGRTNVRLDLDPAGSVFVIFRHAAELDHVVSVNGRMSAASAGSTEPVLKIQYAVYAATDGAGSADVTAKIAEVVAGGNPISANNDLLGGDPVPNHVKELRVDYALNGQSHSVTIAENGTLALPGAQSIGPAPQWETLVGDGGSPVVKLWGNGDVELHTASGRAWHASAADLPDPQEITGAWGLSFPPKWGAPPAVTLDKLISWTDHTNDGVRYFSGTATYDKTIDIPSERLRSGMELWLDLGAVKNFAEVSLNGQSFGVLWKPPFRVNVTSAAQAGANHLVVKVTNLWPNRLIGDEQLPPDVEWNGKQLAAWPQWLLDGQPSPTGRLTFTTWHHWTKDAEPLESGLLGPVTLRTAEIVPAR